ncbi:MAG TPA: DUF1697 domain-containing protein [Anaerolineales bacterium]|nr:DUF1697 domain-containing protein [Anaerolineales bacterium]
MSTMRKTGTHVVLLRGINVGGKNRVPMQKLREFLEGLGFAIVETYIASGNVILESDMRRDAISTRIKTALPGPFPLDDQLLRVLVLTADELRAIVRDRPRGFGDKPEKYHSDVIFLMGIESTEAMRVFSPSEGVDRIWAGKGVIYSERLSSQRTKSRLNRIMATPEYKSMTIRSWATTVKLLELCDATARR